MTYPGPWQQLDDYETSGTMVQWDDGTSGGGAYSAHDENTEPTYGLTGDDAGDMSLRLTQASQVATLANLGTDPIRIYGYLPGLGRPDDGWVVANGTRRFGPRQGATDAPTWLIPKPWPDGATGYEWATSKGTIVKATLELGELVPIGSENDYRDPDNDGALVQVGEWHMTLLVRADQGTIPKNFDGYGLTDDFGNSVKWDYPGSVNPISGFFDISNVTGDDGRFIMLGHATANVSDFDRDDSGSWGCSLDMAITASNPSGPSSPGYGYCAVKYRVRPPLFRWLYDTPPTTILPPLRQFPRDDGLGTSSAARVWPTSSQQGSLRRHGYY